MGAEVASHMGTTASSLAGYPVGSAAGPNNGGGYASPNNGGGPTSISSSSSSSSYAGAIVGQSGGAASAGAAGSREGEAPRKKSAKAEKYSRLYATASVDLGQLRELLWSGIPDDDPIIRSHSWQMCLGYLPPVRERRQQGLLKKRGEYEELRRSHCRFGDSSTEINPADFDESSGVQTLRQIRVDIPRTSPTGMKFFGHKRMQELMERVLYIWSVRHPASGYVQGINDLVTPFVVVLLHAELPPNSPRMQELDLDTVDEAVLNSVEAGAYWCLTKVLSDIQDHYTAGQPGIQLMVQRLEEIVKRIDEKLYRHLESQGLEFLQFSFRWMNCLLLREFPLSCVIRLWDTYIAEGSEGFSTFHVYVCAVFLIYWSPQLKQMDFQQLMLFFQKLPTGKWRTQEIETLLAEAFVLKSLFHASPRHLK